MFKFIKALFEKANRTKLNDIIINDISHSSDHKVSHLCLKIKDSDTCDFVYRKLLGLNVCLCDKRSNPYFNYIYISAYYKYEKTILDLIEELKYAELD